MSENQVQAQGNTYVLRDGVVYKKHGKGEKVVGNPDRVAFVKAAFEKSKPAVECAPVAEAPITTNKKSKH